jgi:DNA transposition AAA+ family ATPase
MINTDGKLDREELKSIQSRLVEYKETSGQSWKVIAGNMGLGESTLSAFAGGTYKGDNQSVALEVSKWFRTEEAQELFGNTDVRPGFQMTATAKYIFAMATYAKLGNIATLIGDPGVGKTFGLRAFAQTNSNVFSVTSSPTRSTYHSFLPALLVEMGVNASSHRASVLSDRVRRVLKFRSAPLVIIDEAQFLSEKLLEELRSIHDETGCGLLFCGNREVSVRIDGNRAAQFAQRSSRVGKRGDLTGPMKGDVETMLEAWGIQNDAEARFLRGIALLPGGGALRQMSKVLEQATLMARAGNEARSILHLKDAADDLNAGLAA